ncbi:MAG: PspA/IM30 family protein [Firmicutes bacterium]|nr:PspA/IM30 family protein [Bacillota bacterium]MBQ6671063.1 PspA/IM30 family protein [Bacillota bacterium]
MGILSRFSDIISANINSLLDKAEDPVKMINKYLIDAREDLAEVKKETTEVMAEETRAQRKVDNNLAEVARYAELSKKALKAGNEGDAKVFIAKKQELETAGAALQTAYAAAHENAIKMRQLYDKLASDIAQLEARKAGIEAKASIAKTQQKVNQYTSKGDKINEVMGAFEKMEDKVNKALDVANAAAELDASAIDEAIAIEDKYKAGVTASVDEELEALKKELGL